MTTTLPFNQTFGDLLDALKLSQPPQPALTIGPTRFPANGAQADSGYFPAPAGGTMTGSVSTPGAPTLPAAAMPAYGGPAAAPLNSARNVTPGALPAAGGDPALGALLGAAAQPRPAPAPAATPGLLDPQGKPQTGFAALPYNVRQKMLGTTFGLDRASSRSLTDNLYLHPENAGILAGTHLDPTVDATRTATEQANLAETGQRIVGQQAQLDAQKRERDALAAASAPGVADQAAAYRAAGGTNPSTMAQLHRETPRSLQTITLKDEQGVEHSFAWDGASAPQRIAPKPVKPTSQTVEVGGRKLTVGPGNKYFDESGKPVDFPTARPPSPPDILIKKEDPELYNAQRTEYLDWIKSKQGAAKPADAAKPDGAAQAPALPKFDAAHEGKTVKGPDGKLYVVTKGVPVLKQ